MKKDIKPFSLFIEQILSQLDCEPDICQSEEEARIKSKLWKYGMPYPVYYSPSDTSGEKAYEEFYTEDETLDMSSFQSLGIVKDIKKKSMDDIQVMFEEINLLFESDVISKEAIVSLLSKHITNFEHIETGKKLDNKM